MSLTLAGAALLGSAITGVGSLIGNLFNRSTTQSVNTQNIAFQREENAITRSREDNAFQRAAYDLQAAGLSKTLAAGSPASSAALTAPQVQAPPKWESVLEKLDLGQRLLDIALAKKQIEQQDANISKTNAETEGINLSNGFAFENHAMDMNLKEAQIKYYQSMNKLNYYNSEIARITSEKTSERIDADIRESISRYNVNWSNIALNNSRKEEIVQSITESVARTNKLNQETENLVRAAIEQRIDILSKIYNMNTYMNVGLPIGGKASMLTQPIYDALMTGGNFISNAGKLFGLKTPSNVFDFDIDLSGF